MIQVRYVLLENQDNYEYFYHIRMTNNVWTIVFFEQSWYGNQYVCPTGFYWIRKIHKISNLEIPYVLVKQIADDYLRMLSPR